MKRLRQRVIFFLETWIQRGAGAQLLTIAALVVLAALVGGSIVWWLAPAGEGLSSSIWWAFLRLTDPGYLGDDVGMVRRTVSTVITVLGYVLFMGSLIAILTQWLQRTMRQLEDGRTPLALSNHIVILGWTSRTPVIIQELVLSNERLRRFLRRRGIGSLHVAVLAEEIGHEQRREVAELMEQRSSLKNLHLRAGSTLDPEDLDRVNVREAVAVIVPGALFSYGGPEASDPRVIKTLATLSDHMLALPPHQHPRVVAEILDNRKTPLALSAARNEVDAIGSDALISRLLIQTVRHPGCSRVLMELLSHGVGNEVYLRPIIGIEDYLFGDLVDAFPDAVPIGVVRTVDEAFVPYLNPSHAFSLEEGDRVILIARSLTDTEPADLVASTQPIHPGSEIKIRHTPQLHRLLVLGWNQRIPSLIRSCADYADEEFEVTFVSRVPEADRIEIPPAPNVQVEHITADYVTPGELAPYNPSTYDTALLVGSDWLESSESADARTVMGYMYLQSISAPNRPHLLVELTDPDNELLMDNRPGEVIVTPRVMSHLLAHVALREELNEVFVELFSHGGADIVLIPADHYLAGTDASAYTEVRSLATERGDILLGFEYRGQRVHLFMNPSPSEQRALGENDHLVLLRTS